jgi:hypothetical protein
MRTSITKSRAGHYTVTVHDAKGHRVFHRNLLSNLDAARRVLSEERHRRISEGLAEHARLQASFAATIARGLP